MYYKVAKWKTVNRWKYFSFHYPMAIVISIGFWDKQCIQVESCVMNIGTSNPSPIKLNHKLKT